MTDNSHKTAIVTGATSGLGFKAAAQLAEDGYGRVTITGRNVHPGLAKGVYLFRGKVTNERGAAAQRLSTAELHSIID